MTPRVIESYRKDLKWPTGHGYGRDISVGNSTPVWSATRGGPLSAEVVHTTSNDDPTSLEHELVYMRDTPTASCNDLIAKNGDVYIILPEAVPAWHAGVALPDFTNVHSFGTELHVSLGEMPTAAQIASLTWRVQQRRQRYATSKAHIETHRAVALPPGRKHDPEGWPDGEFYAWRDRLFASPTLPPGTVPVDPRLEAYWVRSGGIWQADRAAPGYALTPLVDGVQKFERSAFRLNPDGSISALLRSEW